jgi:UDP-glucose 4-epimerase
MVRKMTVTGGAGFIGSNLVRLLRSFDHRVTVIDDLSSGYRENLHELPEVELIEGSILDEEAVQRAVAAADVVFHLAASVGNKRSIDNPVLDSQINVIGTLNVLEAARRAGVRKVVYSSSAGIFGELRTMPVAEDHAIAPCSPYGASKLAGEKHGLVYAELYDLEVVALRYFNVYGPNQRFDAYGNVIPIFVFQMLRGEPITIFGDGEQTRDFIHVADVARANLQAAEAEGISGAFNLGSGERITINRLAQLIAERVPQATGIRSGAPRPGDVRHSLADVRAAAGAFGFGPRVGIEEGLTGYVEWARQEARRPQVIGAEQG